MNAELSVTNPMRTDGFEFVEYAAPDPELLRRLFESMGYRQSRTIAPKT